MSATAPSKDVAELPEPPVTTVPERTPASIPEATPMPQPSAPTPQAERPALTPNPQQLATALTGLYTSKDMKVKDLIVDEYYAPKGVFVDNLVHVSGNNNIKVQFHALGKMCKYVKFDPASSSVEEQNGKHIVKIRNAQEYGIGPAVIKFDVETALELDHQGKIEKHADVWQGQWASYGLFKRILGVSSSMVMRLVRV